MSRSVTYNSENEQFKQFVIVSIVLHVSLLLGVSIKNFLLPSQIIEIPNSVRVDMVALPDKLPEELPSLPQEKKNPEPEKKAAITPTAPLPPAPKVSLTKVKDSQKKALDKLQAIAALEKIKKEVSSSQEQQNQPSPVPQFKGNIISSGNSFTGMSRLRVNEYLENLTVQVRQHWVLPQWLSDASLKTAVVISIDNRGYIIKNEIHSSSGNSIFDSSCLAAVTEASPFPPPPDEVKEALIMIRFPFE